ncbi:uncharacterized protein LOC144124193 [Amblyomma americanum]
MPFGLCNAAQTFQRTINEFTRGLDFVFAYIDDLVASSSGSEHEVILRTLFHRLDEYGLVMNLNKFLFGCASFLKPLTVLLATKNDFAAPPEWTEDTAATFAAAKKTLADATLLIYPVPGAPLCLVTDASSNAVSTVLEQHVSSWQPLGFFSQKLKPPENKYSTFG